MCSVDKESNVFIYDYHRCVVKRVDATTGIIRNIAGITETCAKSSLATGKALSVALNQNKYYQQGIAADTTGIFCIYNFEFLQSLHVLSLPLTF